MNLTVPEAINRATNLFAIGFLGVFGAAIVTEVFHEDEWSHKADDAILFVLAVAGVIWYLTRRHHISRSWLPLGLLAVGLVVKALAAFWLEANDPTDQGDDIGSVFFLAGAIIFAGYQLYTTRRLPAAREPEAERVPAGMR